MSLHFPRPGARTVAGVVAAGVTLVAAPPAVAASVFGGTTRADEPIVLRADGKARKLRSLVIAWEAACGDGRHFPVAGELTAVREEPGFVPDPADLVTSRNARGRFAGTQIAAYDLGSQVAGVVASISGKLRPGRASGRLSADVTILDKATEAEQDTCRTGTVKWSASRAPGRVYGGKTTQDEPIVVRLDRRRKQVRDVLVGWESASCTPPDAFIRFGDALGGFPLRAKRFGDIWDESYDTAGGGEIAYGYALGGKLARRSARGTLRVKVAERDAAGAETLNCDTGPVRWRAMTG
jgi:hypothetical protein